MTIDQQKALALARVNMEVLTARDRRTTRCGFGSNEASLRRRPARRALVRAADDHLQRLLEELSE